MNFRRVVFILIFAPLLSGCNLYEFFAPDEPTGQIQKESEIVELTGKIAPREISLFGTATHNLLDSTGKIIAALESKVESLTKFENEKVKIKAEKVDRAVEENLLSVLTIEKISDEEILTEKEFSWDEKKLSFKFPAEWEKSRADEVWEFSVAEDLPILKLFAVEKETEAAENLENKKTDATEISLDRKTAFRFEADEKITVFAEREKEFLVFEFSACGDETEIDTQKTAFVAILVSVKLAAEEIEIENTPDCGGLSKKLCPENFRCELESSEPDAPGKCVPLSADAFENLEDEKPEESEVAEKKVCAMDVKVCPDRSTVGRDPERNCEFFPCPDPAKKSTENLEENLNENSETTDAENSENSEDSPAESNSAESSENLNVPQAAPENDFVAIENKLFGFSVGIPKNYFWQNFGAVGESKVFIGLSDAEMENSADAAISIAVSPGAIADKSEKTVGEKLEISVPFDAENSIEISGPSEFAAVLQKISDSIFKN